jgi:DNA-binding NarL/FixJ family response regulator
MQIDNQAVRPSRAPITSFEPTAVAGAKQKMALNVLIVDDHPLMRGALRNHVEQLSATPSIEQAGSLVEACRILESSGRRDLILLDLNLPDSSGLHALETLHDRFPQVPVVVVSELLDRAAMLRCIEGGAVGYVPKTATSDLFVGALRKVLDGGTYVPSDARSADGQNWASRPAPRPTPGADQKLLGLTERQNDVLQLILRGLPNKLICRQLQLAEGTVKVHVSAVLRALGVRNRTQAVLAASRLGLRFRD